MNFSANFLEIAVWLSLGWCAVSAAALGAKLPRTEAVVHRRLRLFCFHPPCFSPAPSRSLPKARCRLAKIQNE